MSDADETRHWCYVEEQNDREKPLPKVELPAGMAINRGANGVSKIPLTLAEYQNRRRSATVANLQLLPSVANTDAMIRGEKTEEYRPVNDY